jgi:hypothetical protein
MEYKPLRRDRDEIRVVSIHPSKAYSGRRVENSWTGPLKFEGKEYQSVLAVQLDLADDLVHCSLENISLQCTVNRY